MTLPLLSIFSFNFFLKFIHFMLAAKLYAKIFITPPTLAAEREEPTFIAHLKVLTFSL